MSDVIRELRLTLRDRQTAGGTVPSTTLMGEPFVQLYEGRLKFSGVTGGDFEPTTQAGVFEVGSKLYNSRIENRLTINDNFIISGGTGLISTYGATSGAGLVGKFLSGTSTGFVLGDIADIQGVTTTVSEGANINVVNVGNDYNVATVDSPSFNDLAFSGTATGGDLSADNLSGNTIYSGGTDLSDIISNIAGEHTNIQDGVNTYTGGTASDPTVNIVDSPSFDNITFSGTATGGDIIGDNVSGTTFYSGGTNLEDIINSLAGEHTNVQGGVNTYTGGTALDPTVNVVDDPIFAGDVTATGFTDTSLTDTRVVFVGTGGRLVDDANFTFASGSDVLTIGGSGNLTTNGTQYSGGTIVDDGTFTIDAATQVEIDSDLLPTSHLTYDLGRPGQRWDEAFVRKIRLGTSSTTLEDGLFSSTTGDFVFDFAGDLFVDNNIYPNLDLGYDLGRPVNRWNTIYAEDLDLSGNLASSGLTVTNLTAGRVVYVGPGGELTDEAGFEYDDTNDLLSVGAITVGDPASSGDTNVTIYGNVVIVGDAFSAQTSDLYIEDNHIELNFNPTASTVSTSLGSGWSIQDGSGSAGTDVFLDIRGTAIGVANRSWATNLQDIRIRETGTISSPNGVRVIAEFDCIDGGSW